MRRGCRGRLSSPIRVLIVDDDPLVRAALSMMLACTEDIARRRRGRRRRAGARAVDAYHARRRPDGHPHAPRRRPRRHRALRAGRDAPDVIVLTTFDADDHVLRALRAGASGFLLKDTPPRRHPRAVRLVAAGEPMLSPTVTRRLIAHVTDGGADAGAPRPSELLARLTDREREVALAVAQGKPNAEIAPRAAHERRHRQGARVADADQARAQQPRPGRPARPRRRPRLSAAVEGQSRGPRGGTRRATR